MLIIIIIGDLLDPVDSRLAELADRVRDGSVSDAEREELVLYQQERPDVLSIIQRADRDREMGDHQLQRAQADQRLVALENSSLTQAERRLGVAMVIGGTIGAFFAPAAAGLLVAGAGLLLWSVVRMQIRTAGQDPYKDIEQ